MDHAQSTPIVSVVIPTYMRASAVADALDSIIEPGIGGRLQVIVVDNASTDGTAEAVNARRAQLAGLEFHRWESNVGPLENWKRGIALAKAPWLKVLWSDDRLEPRAIERMLLAAERNNARVVTCRAAVEYPDGTSVNRYLDRPTTLTPDIIISELLHFPAGLPSSPAAVLVRTDDARSALNQRLPEPCEKRAIGPDLLISYWGVFNGGIGVHLPDVLTRLSAGEDSISVRTPRAVLSSCYGAAMNMLLKESGQKIGRTTERRMRSRAALDSFLGGEREALISPRRLSLRATVYDTYQISSHWFRTLVLRQKTI